MPLIRSFRGWDPHPLLMIPAPAETARLAQRHSLVVGYRLQHRTGAAFRIPDRASLSPSAVSTVTANLSSRRSRSAPFLAKYRLGIYANAAPRADSSHPLSAPVLYRHWSFIDTGLSPSPKPFRRIERQSPTTGACSLLNSDSLVILATRYRLEGRSQEAGLPSTVGLHTPRRSCSPQSC